MNKLSSYTIKEIHRAYRDKILTPTSFVDLCLQKAIQSIELNAFTTITDDEAESHAIESEKRLYVDRKPKTLDGITIGIKDNFCTSNIPTTCGSEMLKNFVPTYNATVYARLRKAGACLVGKCNLDEFAMGSGTIDSIFGPTRNPWQYERNNWKIAGGSSGGSAVAVTTGSCVAAIGSDTGGSTRNPAALCGVVGLKPSYGLVSRYGLIPLVNSMDVPGILTRDIDDCVAVLNSVAGPDDLDSTTIKRDYKPIEIQDIDMSSVKIGIPKEYHCEGMDREVIDTWSYVSDILEKENCIVKQVSLPYSSASIVVYSILNQCEVASNMARYDGIEYGLRTDETYSTEELYASSRLRGFSEVVRSRILTGNYFLLTRNYNKYFIKALKLRRLISDDFNKVFNGEDKVDLLLTPTTLSDAPSYEDFSLKNNRDQCAFQDFCTQPANMAGIPAVSIPIRLSKNGLPLSLQLMGPMFSEELMLNVAKKIESIVKFPSFDNTTLADKFVKI
ncbi:glutamyl-tRNA(Gln) amidotransferase subunit A, mitochondrial [Bombyx mori]|uniref:Glutamyl-tRNA(Gln) amidotransferase subunit A, mitochondrial n=1 Tax=Bombyx mori TaxID=7091 RepID=A0A8R2C9Q4_BOMMO|nr:glutamyl-tRNA(Gln) amidotransferase subunit A, mitochondrial [Bombyx mori]